MSRRPNPNAERAAANQNTIKQLLKVEGNKTCADYPRWASWNLGVFICIRCSGIHRGMGTHISRVKSVDLDAWNDEQLQSVVQWGNTRANKYWESKLAVGHVPSDAKIENFIRTKYESKRWVMDGPMPDPSTLDAEGDDDVPLNVVQQKAKVEQASSQRAASASVQAPPVRRPQQPAIDLFGDDTPAPPARPNTTDIPGVRPQAQVPTTINAIPKPNKPGDSLLGLDFFGSSQSSAPARPSSAAATQSRPDLKKSILSLYASVPKPQTPQSDSQPSSMSGNTTSAKQDAFGGLTDAFGGLNFSSTSTTSPPSPQAKSQSSAFGDFGAFSNPVSAKSTPAAVQVTSPSLTGTGFFDSAPKPSVPTKAPQQPTPIRAPSNGLDFSFAQAATTTTAPSKPSAVSASQDLFDDDFSGFTSPSSTAPPPVPPPSQVASPSPPLTTSAPSINSAFNLSKPAASNTKSTSTTPNPTIQPAPFSSQNSALFDPWSSAASADPWSTPDPSTTTTAPAKPSAPSLGKPPAHITPADIGGSWGSPLTASTHQQTSTQTRSGQQPTITPDEDFGGWASGASPIAPSGAAAQTQASNGGNKGFGGAASDADLFSNVWE